MTRAAPSLYSTAYFFRALLKEAMFRTQSSPPGLVDTSFMAAVGLFLLRAVSGTKPSYLGLVGTSLVTTVLSLCSVSSTHATFNYLVGTSLVPTKLELCTVCPAYSCTNDILGTPLMTARLEGCTVSHTHSIILNVFIASFVAANLLSSSFDWDRKFWLLFCWSSNSNVVPKWRNVAII